MRPDIITVVLITMLIGLIITLAVNRYQKKLLDRKYQLTQETLNADFIQKTRDLEIGAKEELHAKREVMDKELFERRKRVSEEERRMERRRTKIDRHISDLNKREKELNKYKSDVEQKDQEIDNKLQQQAQELQRIAGLTKSEAKNDNKKI